MLEDQTGRVDIDIAEDQLRRFFPLLGGGFDILTEVDLTVSAWFCSQPGLATDYLKNRIQTIFLDGKAVDDPEKAIVKDGSTLALSAAMPGMVGSTFRKEGVFASMRSQISHVTDPSVHHDRQIEVKLKLFNLIAKELGPAFLQKGVIIEGEHFQDFAVRNSENFKTACISIRLNDEKTDVAGLLEMDWENKQIFLQVKSEEES